MSAPLTDRIRAQQALVEEHVRRENAHDGTHLGSWRGLPPTGRRVAFPLCGLFTFDEAGRIAGERIYYDRASVRQQIGLFRQPQTLIWRLETLLAHPVTVARAYARRLSR